MMRGIGQRDLVKVFDNRGAVLCAADVSPLAADGVVKSFEASFEKWQGAKTGQTLSFIWNIHVMMMTSSS